MLQRLFCFLVVFLLSFNGEIFGQENRPGDSLFLTQWSYTATVKTAGSQPSSQYIPVKKGEYKKLPVDHAALQNFGFGKQLSKEPADIHFTNCFTPPGIALIKEGRSLQKDSGAIVRYNLSDPLPASYYSANLGFFCKKELQLDKLTPVPIRFRLGSLDYVNYMEQKPNAVKPR